MSFIEFRNVYKKYGNDCVLKNISFELDKGDFLVIVGPSGCGKTTILNILSGLDDVSSGSILINDIIINNLKPKDRNLSMVFQNSALYPYLSVYENIIFSSFPFSFSLIFLYVPYYRIN